MFEIIFRWVLCWFFVAIDIFAQYVLAYTKIAKGKTKIIFWFIYGIYILFFCFPSAIGFFQSNLAGTHSVVKISETKTGIYTNVMNSLVFALSKETNTGYGPRMKEIISNINNLSAQIDTNVQIQNEYTKDIDVYANIQTVLFFMNESLIKLIMFAAAMGMMITALILTSWDILPQEIDKNDNKPVLEVAPTTTEIIKANIDSMLLYVDNLIQEGLTRLNADNVISENSSIGLSQCKRFRTILLSGITKNGKYLIESTPGTSWANFSKDEIKSALMEISKRK